ncbi:MAG: ABC transporter ATP-binding protein [Alphaproteobacteria bacterium]
MSGKTRDGRGADWPLIRRFWRDHVAGQRRDLALVLILMAIVAGVTGLYPLVIDWTFDLFTARDERVVWMVPIAALAVTAAKALATYGQNVLTERLVQRTAADLQKRMFAHLLAADFGQVTAAPAGALVSRFTNDVALVRAALQRATNNLVRDVLTIVALVCAMVWLDWLLSLVVLVVYPVAALPITAIGKRLRRVSRVTQEHLGETTSLLNESLAGVRMVKTYGLEPYERARADGAFERLYELYMRATRSRARLDPMLEVLGGLAVGGVIAFAGWRMVTGGGTVGTFTGFVTALLMAAQPVRAVGTLNSVVQEGMAALERIYALLDRAPAIVDQPRAQPLNVAGGSVALRGVSFAYTAEASALDGIDLEVPAGCTVALVGPSGAGKSTIFNLIPRLFDVGSGAVRIDGQDVRDVTLASLRRAITLVSQDAILFDDTVRANIAFGRPDADDAAIEAAARAAAAHDFIDRLPQGYATRVGERGLKLSGGERQRVALARAILRDAPILLLDEATSALDAESERLVQAALDRLSHGRTTLVIAHRLATVRRADIICVLDRGRIVEQGTHDALIAKDGLYARLSRMQFRDGDPASLPTEQPVHQ